MRSRIEIAREHNLPNFGFTQGDTTKSSLSFYSMGNMAAANVSTVSGTNIVSQLIENQEVIIYDTSSGLSVANLPASPTDGDTVTFTRGDSIADIEVGQPLPNALFINPGVASQEIMGDVGQACLSSAAQEFTLTFSSADNGWV